MNRISSWDAESLLSAYKGLNFLFSAPAAPAPKTGLLSAYKGLNYVVEGGEWLPSAGFIKCL